MQGQQSSRNLLPSDDLVWLGELDLVGPPLNHLYESNLLGIALLGQILKMWGELILEYTGCLLFRPFWLGWIVWVMIGVLDHPLDPEHLLSYRLASCHCLFFLWLKLRAGTDLNRQRF